jgi:hypothetical protein
MVELLLLRSDRRNWWHLSWKFLQALRTYNCQHRQGFSLAQNLALPITMLYTPRVVRTSRLKLSPRVQAELESCLCARLAFTGRFAAERSWQIFRAASGISQVDSLAANEWPLGVYFQNGVAPRTLSLLYHHPGLVRLWSMQLLLWSEFTTEFFRRARHFMRRRHACGGGSKPEIAMINFDQSDWHRGNRAVVHVIFDNKSEWYYKPRPGHAEAFFYSSLRFVSRLVGIRFKTPRLLLRKDYFWMEGVKQQACRNRAEAARFYIKAGILLYLLCRFRGVDFHAGNLITHQTDPVLIDCETLFHPKVCGMPRLAFRVTGFLPLKDRDRMGGDSLSALGRRSPGRHAVMCGGRRVFVWRFGAELLRGFSLLTDARYRDHFEHWLGKNAIEKSVPTTRRLFRSTEEYFHILERSLHSEVLADGPVRSYYLRAACRNRSAPARARAEAGMLEQADIPVFDSRPASVRCFTAVQMEHEIVELRRACDSPKA